MTLPAVYLFSFYVLETAVAIAISYRELQIAITITCKRTVPRDKALFWFCVPTASATTETGPILTILRGQSNKPPTGATPVVYRAAAVINL